LQPFTTPERSGGTVVLVVIVVVAEDVGTDSGDDCGPSPAGAVTSERPVPGVLDALEPWLRLPPAGVAPTTGVSVEAGLPAVSAEVSEVPSSTGGEEVSISASPSSVEAGDRPAEPDSPEFSEGHEATTTAAVEITTRPATRSQIRERLGLLSEPVGDSTLVEVATSSPVVSSCCTTRSSGRTIRSRRS
jgi:hypothetical protein